MEVREQIAWASARMTLLPSLAHSRREKGGRGMNSGAVENLMRIGFSEYEARAYVALLRLHPVKSEILAQVSGIPHSLGSCIAEQLVQRGAAMRLPADASLTYAPTPADELLDRLQQEHAELIASIRAALKSCTSALDPDPVWNIEGEANILARAETMIHRATKRIYVGALPATIEAMRAAFESATERGVQVVVYTTRHLDLLGARVIVTPCPKAELERMNRVGLILVKDGQEALIGEWLAPRRAQASWTQAPTLVSIAEQHLVRGGRRRFVVREEAVP